MPVKDKQYVLQSGVLFISHSNWKNDLQTLQTAGKFTLIILLIIYDNSDKTKVCRLDGRAGRGGNVGGAAVLGPAASQTDMSTVSN